MFLMNLTEEENLTRVSLLIDTGLSDSSFLLCTEFEQFGSITGKIAGQCMLFHINSSSATIYTCSI